MGDISTQVSYDWDDDDPQEQESHCEQEVLERGYKEADDEQEDEEYQYEEIVDEEEGLVKPTVEDGENDKADADAMFRAHMMSIVDAVSQISKNSCFTEFMKGPSQLEKEKPVAKKRGANIESDRHATLMPKKRTSSIQQGNNFQQVQRRQHAQNYAGYFGGGYVSHSMVQYRENMMYGTIGRQHGMQGLRVAIVKKKKSCQVS